MSPSGSPSAQPTLIFEISSIGAVGNQPTSPSEFTLTAPVRVTMIRTYHWNSASGKTPGTIGLRSSTGTTYGPWQAKGAPGQGGVPNAYWDVNVDVTLPAGTYTVVDSDPASWAQNSETGGRGICHVYGYK